MDEGIFDKRPGEIASPENRRLALIIQEVLKIRGLIPDPLESARFRETLQTGRSEGNGILNFRFIVPVGRVDSSTGGDVRDMKTKTRYVSNTQGSELMLRRMIRALGFADESVDLDPIMRDMRKTGKLEMRHGDLVLEAERPLRVGPYVADPIDAAFRVQLRRTATG
jgi:hypothetical protein